MPTQAATFKVHVNPLVDWIWFGFGVMVFGTGHRAAAGARLRVRGGEGARPAR